MFAIYLQYLKKLVSDAVNFLHADKHESFLQIDIMIFDWNGQASQNALTISQKKLEIKLIFCMQINMRVSYMFILTFRVCLSRLAKVSIVLPFDLSSWKNAIKCSSVAAAFAFYCDAKHFDILRGSSHVRCFLFYIILYYLKE